MTLRTEATCPYCKQTNGIYVDKPYGKDIILCEPDFGGCDVYFVVFYEATAQARSFVIGTKDDREANQST